MVDTVTPKQRLVLEAAAAVDYLGPWRGASIETGVFRSLRMRGLIRQHRAGGYEITDDGRALVARLAARHG